MAWWMESLGHGLSSMATASTGAAAEAARQMPENDIFAKARWGHLLPLVTFSKIKTQKISKEVAWKSSHADVG